MQSDEASVTQLANVKHEWGAGQTRVLLFCGSRTVTQFSDWCHKCNISEVSLIHPGCSDTQTLSSRLRDAFATLGSQMQPGDSGVLYLAGLRTSGASDDATEDGHYGFLVDVSDTAKLLVEALPTHASIVCVVDSRHFAKALGLEALVATAEMLSVAKALDTSPRRSLRYVEVLVSPNQEGSAAFVLECHAPSSWSFELG